jgi:hypothetical protein
VLWECFWDRLAKNWCPTNINDFKYSINRPLARPREHDRSRIARVLLAPCSRAARARSTSRPPRVAPALRGPARRGPALRGPAVRAPAVRAPALRAHKIETQGTTFRSSLGMETPDSAEAQRGRGKGLGWCDLENLALCRAAAGVSQDTVRGAGMRQAQYARRIRAELIRDPLRPVKACTQDGTGGAVDRRHWAAGRPCRAGSSGRKSRRPA